MKKTVYDCSALVERMNGSLWTLAFVKKTMLVAIGNIAVAVHDKDTDRMASIQCDLMWCYEIFDTIKEKGSKE